MVEVFVSAPLTSCVQLGRATANSSTLGCGFATRLASAGVSVAQPDGFDDAARDGEGKAAHELSLPKTAGIGEPHASVYMCKDCKDALRATRIGVHRIEPSWREHRSIGTTQVSL